MSREFEFVVVGGGMAGASIAAHLAEHATVCLLEMEDQLGYHSTGRSAAVFSEAYGNETVRALSRASRDFFYDPPAGFCEAELVKPRHVLVTARRGQQAAFDNYVGGIPAEQLIRKTVKEALETLPILRSEDLLDAALSLSPADIEVHELHQGYQRLLKARGGVIVAGGKVTGLRQAGPGWEVDTVQERLHAGVVVNAAGAWAGEIGALAGARTIGMQPLKRTACLIEPPAGQSPAAWPMLVDVEEQFYLKPDAGLLLLSPADETPTAPSDAQADEFDIAVAVDRIQQVTTLQVRRISHRWAGLRSFVADRSPVVGYDPEQPNFFWYAALGGYGIQTAPALSRIGAALARRVAVDPRFATFGVDAAALSPLRLANGPSGV
jgi:D-arginine dehydrogenase